MTSAIALFGAFENHDVRWNGDIDNPWWVAQDVCAILGLANVSQALSSLKESEKDYFSLIDSDITNDDISTDQRKIQPFLIVNEPGLYRLIFKSRKSEAEAFQRWVFHEVLPSIRKTGSYRARPTLDFRDLLLHTDLTRAELRVLALIDQCQGENLSPAAMGLRLGIDRATVARAVRQLEGLGLVETQRQVTVYRVKDRLLSEIGGEKP